MVLITSRLPPLSASLGGSSLRGGLSLRDRRSSLRSQSSQPRGGDLVLLEGSSLRGERLVSWPFLTNRRKCPTWMSSSILSFKSWHSSVECPLFWWYQHYFLRLALFGLATFVGGGINSALSASSKILPLSVVRGVYLENQIGRSLLSLRLSPRWPDRPWRFFSSLFFSPLASARAWLQNSLSSSSCIYLTALFLSSSRLSSGCIHKLSTKGPGHRAVSMWCMTTSGLRFRMLIATLLNLSTKVLSDSPFSWPMPTWCELVYEKTLSRIWSRF